MPALGLIILIYAFVRALKVFYMLFRVLLRRKCLVHSDFCWQEAPEACDVHAVKVYTCVNCWGGSKDVLSVLRPCVQSVYRTVTMGRLMLLAHGYVLRGGLVPRCIMMGVHLAIWWKYIESRRLRNKRCNDAWKWKMFFIAFLVMAQYYCPHYHKLSNFIVDQG